MINLETAELLAGRYLAPVVVVILLSLGVGTYFVSQYKDLSKEKDALVEKEKIFNDQRVEYEREKFDSERQLLDKKADVSRLENTLRQTMVEYNEKLALIQQRASHYDAAENDLRHQAFSVSQNQIAKEAEEKLQKAISEFSNMGVNISSAAPCDPDGLQRYNAARAKYNEALALANAAKLYARYQSFFWDNQPAYIAVTCKK